MNRWKKKYFSICPCSFKRQMNFRICTWNIGSILVSGGCNVPQTKHHKHRRHRIMVTSRDRKQEGSYCHQERECLSKSARLLNSSGNIQFCTVPDHTKFQCKIKVKKWGKRSTIFIENISLVSCNLYLKPVHHKMICKGDKLFLETDQKVKERKRKTVSYFVLDISLHSAEQYVVVLNQSPIS